MADTERFSDQEIVAKTLYGEARDQGHTGMLAIADVMRNRVKSGITWWGSDFRSVCLTHDQFACWLLADWNRANRAQMMVATSSDPQYADALTIASDVMAGDLPDITGGATSYYATSMPKPPKWAAEMIPTCVIIGHAFYRLPLKGLGRTDPGTSL